MDENMKVLLLSLATMVMYFMSMMFILKVRMSVDELPVYTRQTKTGAIDDLTQRLKNVVESMNNDNRKEDEIANISGGKISIFGRIKMAIISTFADSDITPKLIRSFIMVLVINTIVSVLAIKTYGPIMGVMLFMSILFLSLSTLNVLTARKEIKIQKDVLSMMEINFLHYTNSPNFEEAVKKTIDALSPVSQPYKILSGFLDKVYGLNVPKTEAIQDMKSEFGNIPHVNQYLDIVVKAEENDPSYKKAIAGIPDFYSMVLTQKRDFTNAISMVFGAYFIVGMIIIALVVQTTIKNIAILLPENNSPIAYKMYLIGFILYAISGIVVFTSTLKKPERRWGQ